MNSTGMTLTQVSLSTGRLFLCDELAIRVELFAVSVYDSKGERSEP